MNPSEKTQSAAKRNSRLLSPPIRMIKPGCHVATEILEVLASGGKSFRRSQKTTWRLSCWKLNRSEKTQSAAFNLLENEPVRKDTVGCFHLVRMIQPVCHVATESWKRLCLAANTSGGHDKTTWRLSCWKVNPRGG